MPADEGPLSRWSRRKTATRRRGGAAPVIPDAPAAVPAAIGKAATSVDDATALPADQDSGAAPPAADDAAALDLPDIDSLGPESDFTVFMKEGVPAHLRTLALRKLWTSDPVLANLDGLVDYGGDYTHIKSGVFEAVKAILDSGDEDEPAAGPPEGQAAGSKSVHEDADVPSDADGSRQDDFATTGDDRENPPDPSDDAGTAKV